MSTNPTSGLTGQDHTTATTHDTTTSNQGGIIDTVKSYVGLSPTASRDATSGTADATTEPAFGAAVGPNASHSHTGVGAGASEFGSTHTGTGSGTGSSTLGTSNAGAGYTPAPTLNPHDEERAKVVADRATGGVGGSSHSSSGLGSTGAGIGSGVGLGSGVGHDSSRGSGVGLGSGVGHDSSRGSGVGIGSGVGHDSSRGSGVGLGSGVGHDSSHGSGVGLDSSRGSGMGSSAGLGPDGRDTARGSGVGSGVGLDSSREHGSVSGSGAGLTSDNTSRAGERSEVAGSEEHSSHATDNKTAAKRENKDAIPTAGGIKLGEKHWGESDIVPENPKPRADENISSASGQPDQLTSDNTNANTGSAPSSGEGEHKEGIADKVKHTLHIGGSK